MAYKYIVQHIDAGLGASGNRRAGYLVLEVRNDGALGGTAFPCELIDHDEGWEGVYKRYPKAQVTRIPRIRVPFQELASYRQWERNRQEASA